MPSLCDIIDFSRRKKVDEKSFDLLVALNPAEKFVQIRVE
jgi:hypothetical protein